MTPISRTPSVHEVLIWITARNRSTGALETAGFWTGGEDLEFFVEGQTRAYFGVGHVLQVSPIKARAGQVVQSQELRLSGTSPEVEAVMRGYDPRLAPIEIHAARFDHETGGLVAIDRWFKGTIDKAPRKIPAKNESGSEWTLSLVSGIRAMTRPLTHKRSHASQRARLLPDGRPDAFFRYADVAGRVERSWGAE